MRSNAALVAVALALLLVTPTATAALQQSSAVDEPRVYIDVRLAPDGDARWTISTRFALNSSNETEAFRRLAEEYETRQLDVGFSASTFRDAAAAVSERTGRDMAITRVNRSGYVVGEGGGNATGVIALEFTWTAFARSSGNRLVVDDVFAGGWLDQLSANQVLRIHAPEQYSVDTAFPPALLENGTATWTGPLEFERGQPKVVFVPGAGPDDTTTTTPGPGGPTDGAQMVLAVVVALLVGGLGVYAWTQRDPRLPDVDGERDEQVDDPPPEPEDGEEVVVADASEDDDGVDPELLSDEERVERLLRRNGGRMKQADIVTETGWSNAKVSQLLSSMADEERVQKLRIGRENLITLASEDVEDAP